MADEKEELKEKITKAKENAAKPLPVNPKAKEYYSRAFNNNRLVRVGPDGKMRIRLGGMWGAWSD